MRAEERVRQSVYLAWAKTQAQARYNLATSGVADYPLAALPMQRADLTPRGTNFYGFPPLVERLARYCGVESDRLVTALGCSMANFLVMAALVESGDEVIIEQPTYEPLVATAAFLGARVHRFRRPAEAGFQLDLTSLERALTRRTRLIVVTNLHNPTSVALDESTLVGLAELARSVRAYVLVDEVYREAVFDGSVPSASRLGGPFVVTSSLTKAFGLSTLRCGWVVADPDVARRLWRIHDLVEVIPPQPIEQLGCLAVDHLPEIAARARRLLEENRTTLRQFLSARSDLESIDVPHGTVVFPRWCGGRVDDLCGHLKERYDTVVVPGRFFDAPDRFRLGIGGPPELVREGLARLARGLDELAG